MNDPTEHPLAENALRSHIVTYTGRVYSPFDPKQTDISIIDIAHSLAYQCRYAGHTDFFYSVAEHSVIVSKLVPRAYALEGLLHDAAEAYCQDIAAPIKKFLPDYKSMMERNERVVREVYDLPLEESRIVKLLDVLIGRYERTVITKHHPTLEERHAIIGEINLAWKDLLSSYPAEEQKQHYGLPFFRCLPPNEAEIEFITRFKQLTA